MDTWEVPWLQKVKKKKTNPTVCQMLEGRKLKAQKGEGDLQQDSGTVLLKALLEAFQRLLSHCDGDSAPQQWYWVISEKLNTINELIQISKTRNPL